MIYILGAGRSGSTVLDSVLGNHPEITNVGELGGLHRAVWVNNEYCACGKRGSQCEFWTAVLDQWKALTNNADAAVYLAMQRKFERLGFRQSLRLGWERVRRSAGFGTYLEQTAHLYEAISRVSGRRVVVDSSKNPLRAAVLLRTRGIDLRIVHLVRDGRAVAWSVKKSLPKDERGGVQNTLPSRPVWRTVCYWMLVNLLSGWVKTSASARSVRIRYEDFVSDPKEALGRIAQVIDVDLTDVARAAASGESMQVGHTIAGNRLRMAGSVRLQPDWQWMRKLPPRDRRICWAIAGWLLRRYGYS